MRRPFNLAGIGSRTGLISRLAPASEVGSRIRDDEAPGVDNEEQDRYVAQTTRGSRVGEQLSEAPGGKRNDCHEPQESVSSLGRRSDRQGGNGTGDKEQRSGGDARMVSPSDALVEAVGKGEQEAYPNGDRSEAHRKGEPEARRSHGLQLIHLDDSIGGIL